MRMVSEQDGQVSSQGRDQRRLKAKTRLGAGQKIEKCSGRGGREEKRKGTRCEWKHGMRAATFPVLARCNPCQDDPPPPPPIQVRYLLQSGTFSISGPGEEGGGVEEKEGEEGM